MIVFVFGVMYNKHIHALLNHLVILLAISIFRPLLANILLESVSPNFSLIVTNFSHTWSEYDIKRVELAILYGYFLTVRSLSEVDVVTSDFSPFLFLVLAFPPLPPF